MDISFLITFKSCPFLQGFPKETQQSDIARKVTGKDIGICKEYVKLTGKMIGRHINLPWWDIDVLHLPDHPIIESGPLRRYFFPHNCQVFM